MWESLEATRIVAAYAESGREWPTRVVSACRSHVDIRRSAIGLDLNWRCITASTLGQFIADCATKTVTHITKIPRVLHTTPSASDTSREGGTCCRLRSPASRMIDRSTILAAPARLRKAIRHYFAATVAPSRPGSIMYSKKNHKRYSKTSSTAADFADCNNSQTFTRIS